MQPQSPSPAPPPIQPKPGGQNPYSFITDPGKPVKKKLLPSGGTKQSRILIVVGGLLGLAVIATIVIAVISSFGNAQKQEWLTLAQQQQELIRISDIGSTKAKDRETKNIATTTRLSLTSSQPFINTLAKRNGAVFTSKTLTAGKDSRVDAQLTTAEQTNRFDTVFLQVLNEKLVAYEKQLNKLGQDASGNTKASLAAAAANAKLLQKQ